MKTTVDDATSISDRLRKAKLLELFRRYDKAKECYQELMNRYPGDFRAFFNCARLLGKDSDHRNEALELFRIVISIDPSVVEAYGAIAALLIKGNQPDEAVQTCRQGLAIDEGDRTCLYNINVALRQVGCIHEAIRLSWRRLSSVAHSGVQHLEDGCDAAVHDADLLTIVCVKWGTKYGPEYVNNLYAGVSRNISASRRYQVVCFTDDPDGIRAEVRCMPFSEEASKWQSWWLKAQVFARLPYLLGWLLYIDLDTVICGSLDFIFEMADNDRSRGQDQALFYTLSVADFRNEAPPQGMNSSVILWDASQAKLHLLYDYLVAHYEQVTTVIYKFDHYLEMMLLAHMESTGSDATLTEDMPSLVTLSGGSIDVSIDGGGSGRFCRYVQEVFPGRVVDYFTARRLFQPLELVEIDAHEGGGGGGGAQQGGSSGTPAHESVPCTEEGSRSLLPPVTLSAPALRQKPSIVCFPLRPKPHEQVHEEWVRLHWLQFSIE